MNAHQARVHIGLRDKLHLTETNQLGWIHVQQQMPW